MKLLFKQRFFSWFDSYNIYDERENTLFTVEGRLSWGHKLVISDAGGHELGTVKEELLHFLPTFSLRENGCEVGRLQKRLTLFRPRFEIDGFGWEVSGDFMEWDYTITGGGRTVADISKRLFRLTDTYEIDVSDPADALRALMVVLAIDAEKCSRN